jgi:hypothetical protein
VRYLQKEEEKEFRCRSLSPNRKNLDVDHCHRTGKIRGLLCNSCNQGLGLFKDDEKIMKQAADYLKS